MELKVSIKVEKVITGEPFAGLLQLCLIYDLVELDVVVNRLQQKVEKQLLSRKLSICPILLVEILKQLVLRKRPVFRSQGFKSSILLVHDLFEPSQELITVRLRQLRDIKLRDELPLLCLKVKNDDILRELLLGINMLPCITRNTNQEREWGI